MLTDQELDAAIAAADVFPAGFGDDWSVDDLD